MKIEDPKPVQIVPLDEYAIVFIPDAIDLPTATHKLFA